MGIISALNDNLFKAPLKICGKCNYFFEKEKLFKCVKSGCYEIGVFVTSSVVEKRSNKLYWFSTTLELTSTKDSKVSFFLQPQMF